MKMAWKSALRREPVDLLRPNPFYLDLVERLTWAQEVSKEKRSNIPVVVIRTLFGTPPPFFRG